MTLLYNLTLTLHIIFAAAWFGLALPLPAFFRTLSALEPPCAVTFNVTLTRILRQLTLFLFLTLVFGIITLLTGGGFAAYGPRYHTSILLLLLMIGFQWQIQRILSKQQARLMDDPAALKHKIKQVAMFTGINHLFWLIILILMLWNRFRS